MPMELNRKKYQASDVIKKEMLVSDVILIGNGTLSMEHSQSVISINTFKSLIQAPNRTHNKTVNVLRSMAISYL